MTTKTDHHRPNAIATNAIELITLGKEQPYDFLVKVSGDPKGYISEHYDARRAESCYLVHTLDGDKGGHGYGLFTWAVGVAAALPTEIVTIRLLDLNAETPRMDEAIGLRAASTKVRNAARASLDGFMDATITIAGKQIGYISRLGAVRLFHAGTYQAIVAIDDQP